MASYLLPEFSDEGAPSGFAGRFLQGFEHGFERVREAYGRALASFIAHRRLTLIGVAVMIVGSLPLMWVVGQDFFPSVDSGLMRLHVRAPTGTRIEATEWLINHLWLQSVTDTRNQGLVLKHGISQQTADNSRGSMLQARDTYIQLRAMQAYEVVTAPFDGIVTARYLDPGALVAQTTSPTNSYLLSHVSETATPIVMLATLSPIRVYASAPQNVANLIQNGAPATISVEQRPGRDTTARITRHPEALDSTTRMMLVEADLPNSDGALYPGMYGTMTVTVKVPASAPLVSDDVLVFRDDKVLVPVVRNSIVHLAPVTLGYDNGYAVEATSGISMNDLIAVNLGQSASEGERVQPIEQKS
jgi:RND family efflux transporter MFP subunit